MIKRDERSTSRGHYTVSDIGQTLCTDAVSTKSRLRLPAKPGHIPREAASLCSLAVCLDNYRTVIQRKLVVFDFDGTLADSFPWFVEAFDQAAERFRFRKLDRSQLDAARALDAQQLLVRHGIPLWKVPSIARYMRTLMQRDIAAIPLFPGIDIALETLQARGVSMAVITSNSRENVLHILGPRNAARFLDFKCGSSLFGKGIRLRQLLAANRVAPADAIFVGDEIRDLKAAGQAGIAFGAVGWGYTHLHALVSHGARETFSCVDELIEKLGASVSKSGT